MSNHYRRQADAFLALAREEPNSEVKLLFLELAEGYRLQADAANRQQAMAAIPVAA